MSTFRHLTNIFQFSLVKVRILDEPALQIMFIQKAYAFNIDYNTDTCIPFSVVTWAVASNAGAFLSSRTVLKISATVYNRKLQTLLYTSI